MNRFAKSPHATLAFLLAASLMLTPRFGHGQDDRGDALTNARQMLSRGEPIRIVCFGDSITGVYYHSGAKRAWCDMLGILLHQSYPNAKLQMVNAGRSGHTTADALARIDRDVIAKRPHLVVIAFGMNDVARIPFADFEPNLREIVRRCQAAGAEVVLCTPNAVSETEARPEAKVAQYSATIRAVAADLQLPIVDIFAAWQAFRQRDPLGWSLAMSDEIHPNMTGHLTFAELIGSTIVGQTIAFEESPPPLDTLKTTFARLANREPIKLVAAPPYDVRIPDLLRRLYPDAKFEVVAWPAAEQSVAEAAEWAKRIRGLNPHLVIPPFSPQWSQTPQAEFIRDYEWLLNYSLPQSDAVAWDVVPMMPLDAKSAYAPIAAQIAAGKDLRFIHRRSGDQRADDEIVAAWIAAQLPNEKK